MKKRMQILMSMTLTAFLFLGLTSLNAQSFNTGPTVYTVGVDGKTLVEYQEGATAVNTIGTELQFNYPLDNPPTASSNPTLFYKMNFLRAVRANINSGEATNTAIFRGFTTTVNAANSTHPSMNIDEAWMEDVVTLLSN